MAGLLDDLGGYSPDLMGDMGGYSPWQSGTTGSMTAYHPSWRDQLSAWLMGDKRPSLEQSRFAEGLTGSRGFGVTQPGVLDATPAGLAFAGNEAYRDPTPDNVIAALPFMPGAKGARAVESSAVRSGPQMSAPSPAGIRAYHGSPHDFERFDMSKIGTGEGAQAFGHGLYFAENVDVARSYRNALSNRASLLNNTKRGPDWIAENKFINNGGNREDALMAINEDIARIKNGDMTGYPLKEYEKAAKILDGDSPLPFKTNGRMYEVRVNADPADFMDWDKPLSQQPEKVREAIAKVQPSHLNLLDETDPYNARDGLEKIGSALLKPGQPSLEIMSEASNALRDAGIPGIKYLDKGSRTAGEGSRNYVVFDDKLIDILKKYGIAGTMVAGGGMAVSSSDVEAHPALIPLLMGTAGLMAGDLSNSARDAELMLNRQSPRLYDYAPQPGMLDLMGTR